MKKIVSLISLFSILFSSTLLAKTDEFPGRAEYPEVKLYSKQDLKDKFNQVLIVDTRSNYEYETIHINSSINIPISSKSFTEEVQRVRNNSKKPIVFYCNGRTCYKSYKATITAMKSNIDNVYAYDAGMFEWAETYPEQTTLLNKSPINTTDLLNKEKLKSHTLSPIKFADMMYDLNDKARVLDIRDLSQRANGVGYFVGIEYWIDLNRKKKIIDFIRQAKKDKKTLMIYDSVGKQVRWLQYTLERENIKSYYFMKQGAKGFYNKVINAQR